LKGEIEKKSQIQKSADGDVTIFVYQSDIEDRNVLGDIADKARDFKNNMLAVIVGQGTQPPFIITSSKALKNVNCGDIAKELSNKFGGKGGGRPDRAQGSFNSFKESEALDIVKSLIQ
jgi:alanyl-tRNA synthetase